MLKSTLFFLLPLLLCLASCKKEDGTSGRPVSLPVTVDFTKASAESKTSFTMGGMRIESGGGDWRKDGNCASTSPAQPFSAGSYGISFDDKYYMLASGLVAHLNGAAVHKVTVKMNAPPAYDDATLQPATSACISLCNGGNVVAETREPQRAVKDSIGQVVYQIWELNADGKAAQKLIISSDHATLYSMTIE